MTQQTPSAPQVPDRYRLVSCLGKGGMGSVWLAEDSALERQVAIKVPHLGDDVSPEVVHRFKTEARAAAKVTHDNLCPIHDVGEHGGLPFLVMPFIEGKPLSKYTGRPWPPERAIRLVAVLAKALAAVHAAGLVHRDLKPANVMMRADGRPVLMDFGLAASAEAQSKRFTREGAMLGTPAYMAPEQVEGRIKDMGPATDIYGLGVILFELLTGRTPFEGPPLSVFGQILHTPVPGPSELSPGIDPRLDAVCRKALAKRPEERFASMAEFAQALAAGRQHSASAGRAKTRRPDTLALDTEVFDVPEPGPLQETTPSSSAPTQVPPRRRSPWLVVAGVMLLIALLPLGWLLSGAGKQEQTPDPTKRSPQVAKAGLDGKPGKVKPPEGKKNFGLPEVKNEPRPMPPPPKKKPEPVKPPVKREPPAAELPKEVTVDLGKGIKLELVRIEPGEFLMGASGNEVGKQDEYPQHKVRVTKSFYLGKYEVTQEQYKRVAPPGSVPSYYSAEGGGKGRVERMDTNRFPAEMVSWNDATAVCERLNRDHLSGLPEALRKAGYRFRLPTEVQWEYACRAGTTTPFHFGKELNGTQANCDGNLPYGTQKFGKFLDRTVAVGSYPPNSWGLYDMHGNVREWCEDSNDPDRYISKLAADRRALRGGSFNLNAWACRAAHRDRSGRETRHSFNGFRVSLRRD
jgi:formylglycine-generating enzyme required for sulfatase activity/serine/threonine protein kinase